MNWRNWHLYGDLAALALLAMLICAALMFVYTTRLRRKRDEWSSPLSEGIGAYKLILRKVRKGEPMSRDEVDFANQVIADRSSLWAFSIPGAIFSLGCFYVLGSLEQLHGATPSERVFIGVIPMFSSINIAAQILRVRVLRGRVPKAVDSPQGAVPSLG